MQLHVCEPSLRQDCCKIEKRTRDASCIPPAAETSIPTHCVCLLCHLHRHSYSCFKPPRYGGPKGQSRHPQGSQLLRHGSRRAVLVLSSKRCCRQAEVSNEDHQECRFCRLRLHGQEIKKPPNFIDLLSCTSFRRSDTPDVIEMFPSLLFLHSCALCFIPKDEEWFPFKRYESWIYEEDTDHREQSCAVDAFLNTPHDVEV